MEKENKVKQDVSDVSLAEYQAWEHSKSVKSTPDPDNTNVLNANEISIVDYARKNALNVVSENGEQAVIEDPATNQVIVVHKQSNSWTGKDLDGNDEKGKMIRFYLKVNRIYPESKDEYINYIHNLGQERKKYLTNEQYNKEYLESKANVKEPKSLKQREKKGKHDETVLANSISIMDVARKKNYVILSEDDIVAKIKDPVADGEITVRKDKNTWYAKNLDDGWTNGKAIRFLARMEGMEPIAATDYLLENRAKYITNEEYNENYKKVNLPEKEVNLDKSETVEAEKVNDDQKMDVETKNVAKEKDIHLDKVLQRDSQKCVSKEQLAEIIAGTRKGIDIKVYDKLELSPDQMRQIRLGLEKGINLSAFAYKDIPSEYIKEVRLAEQQGLNTDVFKLEKNKCIFSAAQAKEIRLGLRSGLSEEQMKIFARKELSSDIMHELRIGLQDGLDVMKDFNNGHYKAQDIHTIRMNLTVRKLIEALKQKLTMVFEVVSAAFQNSVKKQAPALAKQEVAAEAELETRDIVKDLYETIEDSISEKNLEEKKEILAGVFQKVVAIGTAIEQIYPEDKASAVQMAANKYVETAQEKQLQSEALESLKTEYKEQFELNEQAYNENIAEFTIKLSEDATLSAEQKNEILQQTVGKQFGEELMENIKKHLPEPVAPIINQEQLMIYEEVMEYMEDFEMEQ